MPKKFLCVILCIVMLATALPFCAYAQEIPCDYIDGEVIIHYNQVVSPDEDLSQNGEVPAQLAECGITSLKEINADCIYDTSIKALPDQSKSKESLYIAKTSISVEKACRLLNNCEGVISCTPNYLFEHDSIEMPIEVTNPTSAFNNYTDWWFNNLCHIPEAWSEFNTLGEDVVIAVLDSGLYVDNLEFAENIWEDPQGHRGYNAALDNYDVMPETFHGTHVTSIAAAATGYNLNCIGVAPKAKIMPIKIALSPSSMSLIAVIAGINYAIANSADIISMSFSTTGNDATLRDACKAAYEAGIILVSSAGNNKYDLAYNKRYPAAYDTVISVMAMNKNYELCDFSCYDSSGNYSQIAAPGYAIVGASPSPSGFVTAYASGTSQATPIVAGIAALYLSVYPDKTPAEFKHDLLASSTQTCRSNPTVVTNTVYNYALPNALNILRYPNATPTISSIPGSTVVVDNEQLFIHGLNEGYSSIDEHIAVSEGTYEFIPTENGNGTGSVVRIYTLSGDVYADYTIVIFGDTDGDAKCDGRDALLCDYTISGATVPDYLTFASDVNFDNIVNEADSAIIAECGVFRNFVDQIR